jgi:hypothetical protein
MGIFNDVQTREGGIMARKKTVEQPEPEVVLSKKSKKAPAPKIEMKSVSELLKHVHSKNPRQHPEFAVGKLVKSIEEFGWTNPVLLDADGRVIAGHARLKAAQKSGITEVPTIMLPFKGAKADAYLIADNRLQQDTMWEPLILKDLFEQLSKFDLDMTLTGFEQIEISKILAGPIEDEEPPVGEGDGEDDEPPTTQHECPQCGYKW